MSTKTNKNPSLLDQAQETAANAGMVLMALAVTAGLVDISHQPDKRVVLPMIKPAFGFATTQPANDNNPLRRERDDLSPHYVSYSVYQRTPSRHGKH